MQIIKYSDNYKDKLLALILDIQNIEFGLDLTIEDQKDLLNIQNNYQNNGNFWLAISEKDDVIGCIAILKLSNKNSALKKMFVHNEYRKLGVGNKLLQEVFEYCNVNNIERIYLGTIDIFVSAQSFYKNNGFKNIVKNDLPADFPVMEVDNTFLVKIVEK